VYKIMLLGVLERLFALGTALGLRSLLLLGSHRKAWQMYPEDLQSATNEKPSDYNSNVEPETRTKKTLCIYSSPICKTENPQGTSNIFP